MNESGMKTGRVPRLGMIAAAIVIASINCTALSQTKAKSPYDSQDLTVLGAELVRLGMEDILGQLVKEQGTANLRPDQLVLSAQYDLAIADPLPDDARDKKMDEGIAKLEKAVKMAEQVATGKGKDDAEICEKKLALYQYQLMLGKAIGIDKAGPYFARVKSLLSGKRDAVKLGECAGKSADILRNLYSDLGDSIENWGALAQRGSRNMADQMKLETGYRLAWVEYYHAVSMKDGGDKDRELTECQNAVEPYAHPKAGDDTGVKYTSLLLSGRCHRELRQYKDAMEDLKAATDPAADGATRLDAQLEMIRCAIDEARFINAKDASTGKAQFAVARGALEDFRKIGEKFPETDHKNRALYAFYASVLENYLYETWASCDQSDEAKKDHTSKAQAAIMSWPQKFTDRGDQAWYWQQWSYKSGDMATSTTQSTTTSKPSASGAALLARAMTLFSQAMPSGGQEPTATQLQNMEEAERLFGQIIASNDSVLASSRGQALFSRGELLVALKKNRDAAVVFAQVASEYKDQAIAGKAALDVVMIWSGVIAENNRANKEIVPRMRQVLVEAIDVLLGNPQWAKEDWARPSKDLPGGIVQYHFDRGFQCQMLAELDPVNTRNWLKRAVESYEQVPATAPEIMDARFGAIESRFGLMKATSETPATGPATQTTASPAAIKTQAAELVRLADSFIADCASQTAGKNKPDSSPEEKATVSHLVNLEAGADFIKAKTLCDFLGQEAQALTLLATLGAKYPNTTIIRPANVYEIQRLINQGKINGAGGAVEKVKDFSKRFPTDGPYVMGMLITQIRDSIHKMVAEDLRSQVLVSLRKDYLDFAKTLYEADKSATTYRQIYGDALIENDKADESIVIFQQCLVDYDKLRQAESATIDALVKKKTDDVNAAAEDAKKLKAEAIAFFAKMDEKGVKVDDSMDAIKVKNAQKALTDAENPAAELTARKAMVKALSGGWQSLGLKLKKDMAIDDVSTRGLGRAYYQKKQYDESLKYYRQLAKVIFSGRLRWQIRAEHAQAAFENSKDKPEELKNLRAMIWQWKMEDDKMGDENLKNIFSTIENNINQKVAGKPESK